MSLDRGQSGVAKTDRYTTKHPARNALVILVLLASASALADALTFATYSLQVLA